MANQPTTDKSSMWSLLNLKKGSKRDQAKRIEKISKKNRPVEFSNKLEEEKETRRTKFNVSRYRMNLWKNAVHRNRLADQITFPLDNKKIEMYNSEQATDRKRAKHEINSKRSGNPICSELYNVLYKNKPSEDKEIPFSLKEQSNIAIMLAKKAELNKRERARKEVIVKRLIYKKKIKSKNFHRHQKHRNMKEFEKETEKLRDTDPEGFAKRLLEAEKARAMERISQKHKGGSKFAKMQKMRAKYDKEARDAVSTMYERGSELLKRSAAEDSDLDAQLSSSDESDTEMSESDEVSDDEEQSQSLAEAQWWKKTESVAAANSMGQPESSEAGASKPILSTAGVEKLLQANEEQQQVTMDTGGVVHDDDQAMLQANIQELCGTVEVNMEDDFQQEKDAINAEEALKDADTFLPGWNSWTGPGFEKADEKRRKRRLVKAPQRDRKDSKLKRVIIRESVNKKAEKHLVKTIPFPYDTPDQFQKIMEQPIGREFNTEVAHKKLVKPRVIVHKGKVINPLTDSSSILREKDVERLLKNKLDV